MATVSERIAQLENPKPDTTALELEVLRMLPAELPAPGICNFGRHEHDPAAWLGFSGPAHDPEHTFDALAVLRALESAGWKTAPATLVKKDDYRPSPQFGLIEDIPEKQGRYTVTETTVICPLWIVPEQHTGVQVKCFMVAPNGKTYHVHVNDYSLQARISAERHNRPSEWYFEHNTAKLHMPDSWHTLFSDDQPIAQREVHSRAYVDTEQGISGAIYWEPIAHEQEDFPLSVADMLETLRNAQAEG